jgi:hypothetical protein
LNPNVFKGYALPQNLTEDANKLAKLQMNFFDFASEIKEDKDEGKTRTSTFSNATEQRPEPLKVTASIYDAFMQNNCKSCYGYLFRPIDNIENDENYTIE